MRSGEPSEVLACYPPQFRPLRVESVGGEMGFSGAGIFSVTTEAGRFCLRQWPASSLPKRRILRLHRLLKHIFEQGVPQVAVPVAAKNQGTLVHAAGRIWQLEPWMPGTADFWNNPSDVRLRAAVSCLARWHRAAETYDFEAADGEWFVCRPQASSPAVIERMQILSAWDDRRQSEMRRRMSRSEPNEFRAIGEEFVRTYGQVAPQVAGQLQAAAPLPFRLQPCLRDVWHDHVLFSEDEVTGLIDASACRSENVAADLARLLGSLLDDDRSKWAVALDEYAKHRPLNDDERRLVDVLDRSGVLLSGMTWLERRYFDREKFASLPRVVERLKKLLVRLNRLAETL